ncbi:hypothetical protein RN001_013910 [Aquatica leii]|uniref:Sodium-coupled monocarboxylate transporter 1 n=1 Tax=Aquatica leii TaxID=1421715 RepID=A0AAN7Q0A1_9COLE|nr:hypothetical protein RN001_013910 [Aquatica leii]
MDYLRFAAMDYLLFVFMFGVSCIIGIYFGCFHKQTTTTDYLLGGRKMNVFPVSMSLVASTLSGVSLIAIPAEVYMHGFQIFVIVFSIFISSIINYFVYLPVFYKIGLTSVNDYLEIRFDRTIKRITSILYIISCILLMPFLIYAPSLAFNQMSGIDMHIIAPVMTIICVFYTTIGGIKAVVWTDTLQFLITLCTLAFVLVMGIVSVGGFSVIWTKSKSGDRLNIFNMDPDPTIRSSFWSVFIGNVFTWSSLVSVNPAGVQRFISVSKLRDAKKVLAIFTVFAIAAKAINCFSGLIVYAKYSDCDPLTAKYMQKSDQIVPYYVKDVASQIPGISGLFVAGIFSTALSSLSTQLNSVSGILYLDFMKPCMPVNISENKSSTIIKLLTILLGLLNVGFIFVIEQLGSLLELLSSAVGITGGPILGAFTLGMLFPVANKKGTLVGIVSSLVVISVIIIKNQIYVWNGDIKITPKPLNSYGCNKTEYDEQNRTVFSTIQPDSDSIFWLYKLSFHYYVFIGTAITIIVGLLVSLCTKKKSDLGIDHELFSPCLHRFRSSQRPEVDQDLKLVKYTFSNKK